MSAQNKTTRGIVAYLLGEPCPLCNKRHRRGADNSYIHGRTELGVRQLYRHTKLDPAWRPLRLDHIDRTTRPGEQESLISL